MDDGGALSELLEEALAMVGGALSDQRIRILKLESESKQNKKMATRYHHRLKASATLANLAYAYSTAVDKAASADLKGKYPHISDVKGVAKAILGYLKTSDKHLVPYKDLGLNIDPLLTETRRLKNSGALGLAVFSLCEDD